MPDKKLVLLVEDNEKLNAINRRALTLEGYQVLTALTLGEARAHLDAANPDVIVLDILLPDGNGVDFCREIRETTTAPILFLTSVQGYRQALEGMAAGGDDYLTKPFGIDMLLAKVSAFLRRDAIVRRMQPARRMLSKGALRLDTLSQQAYLHGEDMLLTPKEFALLLLLVQYEGETLGAAQLYAEAWQQPMAGDTNAVKVAISRLRGKLGDTGYGITSTRGAGYCFEAREE